MDAVSRLEFGEQARDMSLRRAALIASRRLDNRAPGLMEALNPSVDA